MGHKISNSLVGLFDDLRKNSKAEAANGPLHTLTAIVFFFSGFSTLLYQVVWQRVLTQEIGADSISVTFIVTIFMIGLGFGSFVGGWSTKLSRKNLIILYFSLEVFIGLFGIISIELIRYFNSISLFNLENSITSDFIINCGVLFFPIFMMGMTSPIIMDLMKGTMANWGRVVGRYYGVNILGAALGAVVGGILFIELFGLQGTANVAVMINFAIAAVFLIGYRRQRSTETPDLQKPDSVVADDHDPIPLLAVMAAAVLFGFTTLALQMVFFRILANYFTLSTSVFPMMLAAYLVLMSSGQALSGILVDRLAGRRLGSYLYGLFFATVLFCAISMLVPPWATVRLGAMVFTPSVKDWEIGPVHFGDPNVFVAFVFALFLMLPVLFASGYFPAVVRAATRHISSAGYVFGLILFSFTLGNIIGAYVTGIFLFEMIGTKGALIVTLLVLYLSVVFLTSFNRQYGNSRWRAPIMGALAVFFLFVAVPQNYYMSFGLGRYQPIDVIEGKTGVLSVVPSDESYYRLDMFRTESAAVLARYSERGLSEWNMSELFVLDPSFRPKKLLIIGMGHGYLARAMMDYPFIESITLVELSQEVVDAVKKYSAPEMMEIFTSPKVNLVVADGRRFVQQSLDRGETYDLIQININNPWRTGASSLYTEEFIAKLKSSLAPDGYLATRAMIGYVVQGLYSFKQAFWPGRTHVYFRDSTDRFTGPLEVRSEIAEFYLPPDFASNSSTSTTANDVSDVLEIAYFDQSFLNGFQRNVDDHPTFEYRYLEDRLNRYRNPKVFMVTMDLAEFVSPVEVKVTEFD